MEVLNRELTIKDIQMFLILKEMAPLSRCKDKQVACLITDIRRERVYGIAVNDVTRCDQNCHDKENRICEVVHAEVAALREVNQKILEGAVYTSRLIAYVNLFPCVACQKALEPFVHEICAIGPVHKEVVYPVTVFDPKIVKAFTG